MSDKLIGLDQNQLVVHGHLSSGAYTDVGSAATADAEDFELKGTVKTKEKLDNSKTLDLNFTRGVYSKDDGEYFQTSNATELLTVERATPKWVFGPNGKLREVLPNTLARQWNPETGEPEGVLIEEQRTNLLLWSEDFTQESWLTARVSLAVDAITAPDGLGVATKLIEDDSYGSHAVSQSGATILIGVNVTVSTFVKKGERSKCEIRAHSSSGWASRPRASFDIDSGTIISGDGGIEAMPNGWFRVWATGQSDTVVSSGIEIFASNDLGADRYEGDGTSGIYVWGAQVEVGYSPTSYIPTGSAQVTRAADTVRRPLGEEFNANEGTIYVKWLHVSPNDSLVRSVLKIRNNERSHHNSLGVEYFGSTPILLRLGVRSTVHGVSTYYEYGNAAEGVNEAAIAYKAEGTITCTLNGQIILRSTVGGDFSAFLRELNEIMVGDGYRFSSGFSEEGRHSNQPVLEVSAFPRALSEQELIALTTPED